MRLLLVGTNLNAMQKSSDLESRVYESCDVKCKLPKYHLLSFQELSSYLEDNTTRFVIVDKSTDGDFLRIDYQHQSFNKVVSSLIRMRGYKFGSYRSRSKFGAHDLVTYTKWLENLWSSW
ncbi:PREDICTED: uncharacterized protein LOC104791737 [Camelina sativa]|uniref:Uncharacterized protein LOC104791737 n=1 Tax=Camelina sativa TaxID=90675 RepID=A0ABM0ZHZ9_CAMSA|nr:PREDICTED: uncharacterized protein LOC104791737 [Camelina sativa]